MTPDPLVLTPAELVRQLFAEHWDIPAAELYDRQERGYVAATTKHLEPECAE